MIVLDASAVIELLLGTPSGRAIALRISDPGETLHAPHLVDVEVEQALRRYVRAKEIGADEAAFALGELRSLDIERHAHEPLLERVWALREHLTAYDATYVALGMALDATLVTCDARLARLLPKGMHVELVR
jgi:predicted nucleic acid-binding protein